MAPPSTAAVSPAPFDVPLPRAAAVSAATAPATGLSVAPTSPSPASPSAQPDAAPGDAAAAPPASPPAKHSLPPPPLLSPPPPRNASASPPKQSPAAAAAPPPRTVALPPATFPPVGPPAAEPSAAPAAAPPSSSHPEQPHHLPPPTPSHRHVPLPAIAVDPNIPSLPHSPNKSTSSGDHLGNSLPAAGLSVGFVAAIAAAFALFLVLSLVGAAVWYSRKKNKKDQAQCQPSSSSHHLISPKTPGDSTHRAAAASAPRSNSTGSGQGMFRSMSEISVGNSRCFSYMELYEITGGFSPRNLLGEGGFGSVYKACLPEGREVAVKRLKDGGGQGEREFQAEVEIISRVHHRHLVSLVGYCIADEQRLLVYDFVPNNNLHYHLHGHGRPVLEWPIRVRIAAGAARGIAYLHEDCQPRIIHRDIKSSNILLDNNFEAQVADFGLARLAVDTVTHVTTRVMGTFGYLAPEYASSGKLTERSDVYSFGVVLLELITGRKPVDPLRPLGEESLVEWARPVLSHGLESGNLEELVDPRLGKSFDRVEMLRMIEAAAACIRYSAPMRPRMSQVMRVLDSLADIDLSNGIQPGKSGIFNVASTAEIKLFRRMAFPGQADESSDFSDSSWSRDTSGQRNL